jgi:tRNA-uridine 2-sulfurtransferase
VADVRPRYVLGISPTTRTVTIGPEELLGVDGVTAGVPTWCGAIPALPFSGLAQLRAHGAAHACTAEVIDGVLVVRFDDRPRGVAPGQTVALYDGDRVVGSATIDATF